MGKKRQIVEAHEKEERKKRRKELGTLHKLTIQPSTVVRYEKAFRQFLQFLSNHKSSLGSTKEVVDSQAQEFIEFLWEEGEGQSLAADTLSAIQHFQPSMKRNLTGSWRLLKTWQRHEIPARSPPLTWYLTQVLMGYFHAKCPLVALAIGVAFKALLRTGELLSLQSKDIVIPQHSHSAVFYLGDTKTAPRNPHAGTVTCHDARLVTLLKAWQLSAKPEDYLVPWTQSKFRSMWNAAMNDLNLVSHGYKPYSLRRGGATDLYLTTRNYSHITHVGRWTSERTAKIYIRDSIAIITELTFKPTRLHSTLFQQWQAISSLRCVEPRRPSYRRGRGRGA